MSQIIVPYNHPNRTLIAFANMNLDLARPKQSIAMNATKARCASEIQIRFERIDYTKAFSPVLKQSDDVKVMLKVLRDMDPFLLTLDNALLYCKYWSCLHQFLQKYKPPTLTTKLLFNLNTHVTDSYTFQLLFFVNRTVSKSRRQILDKILKVPDIRFDRKYKSWTEPFKIEVLEEAFDQLSELLGILYYSVKIVIPRSRWAMDKICETCQILGDKYENVRGLLCWVSGELEISSEKVRNQQEIADWLGTSAKIFTENLHFQKNYLWLKPIFHRIKLLQIINKAQYHSIVLNKQGVAADAYEYAKVLGWNPNKEAITCMKSNRNSLVKTTKSTSPEVFEYIGPMPNYRCDKFKKGLSPLEFIQLEPI